MNRESIYKFFLVLLVVSFTKGTFAQKNHEKQRLYVQDFTANSDSKDYSFIIPKITDLLKVGLQLNPDIEVVDKGLFLHEISRDSSLNDIRSMNYSQNAYYNPDKKLDSILLKNKIRFVLKGEVEYYENKFMITATLVDLNNLSRSEGITSDFVDEADILLAFNSFCKQLNYYLDLSAFPDKARVGGAKIFRSVLAREDEFDSFLNQISNGLQRFHSNSYIVIDETSEDYSEAKNNEEISKIFKNETKADYLLGGEFLKDTLNKVYSVKYYIFSKQEGNVTALPINLEDPDPSFLGALTLPPLKNWLSFLTSPDSLQKVINFKHFNNFDSILYFYNTIPDSNYREKLYILSKAESTFSDNWKILFLKAKLEFNNFNYYDALVYLKKLDALHIQPPSEAAEVKYLMASDYEKLYRYEESLTIYKSLLSESNPDKILYKYIGDSYYYLGKDDSASYFLKKYMGFDSNNKVEASDVYLSIGNIFYSNNQPDSAGLYFSKAIMLNQNNKDAKIQSAGLYCFNGTKFMNENKYKEAIVNYTKANSIYETRSGYEGLKEAYYTIREFSKADSVFEKVIKDSIYDTDNYYEDNGYLLRKLAKPKNDGELSNVEYLNHAITYFKKAKEQKSNSDQLENSIGVSYEDFKQFDSAIVHYNKAISLNSFEATYYLNLAETQILSNKAKGALETLNRLSKYLKPNDPNFPIYYYLKIIAQKMDSVDSNETEVAFNKLVKAKEKIYSSWDFTVFIAWMNDPQTNLNSKTRSEISSLTTSLKKRMGQF